jgi:phosphatidylglycerol:prolipoprotein diacylglycerol transferase
MRPRLVELLAPVLGDTLAVYLVPRGTTLLLAAICAVLWLMLVRARRAGLAPRRVLFAALVGVLGGLAGARIVYLLQHLSLVTDHPRVLLNLAGGTTSWGAYLGGTAAFTAWLRWRREPVLRHADLLAACLGLGPVISRWGCLMSGCCFGRVTDVPWAVRFPAGSFAHTTHVEAGLLPATAPLSCPVHPVQVYASLAGVLVFVAASLCWRRFRERPGLTFACCWLIYATLRFVTEFFRGDVPRHGPLALTQSQVFAAVLAAGAAVLSYRRSRTGRSDPGSAAGP